MKQLAILLPNGATTLSSLILTVEVFEKANEYFITKGKKAVFKTVLVGNAKEKSISNGSFTVHLDKSTEESDNTDLIIVPSLGDDIETSLKMNKKNIDWVIRQYKNGAEVASLCTGAFILASAGLLDGKQCSTHWSSADIFKSMFPEVDLAIDKIITDEHGIYTTGGAISSMNLVLHIVEKYYNRETAIYIAKVFEIDLDRNNQSAFVIFSGQKNHEDAEIGKAQLFIENNFSDKIIVENLSAKFSIDRRNFDRRFKKATGNSPLEYMQRVKVEAAKKSLETSRKTVSEVMYDVGYADVKAFREVFKKITGLTPVEYRGKYNKEAVL
ncbi:MAG TPA: helix-turn-helix domain-containing protein [Chitinophagaceae bacterium]|jgi:transcriptional regulator GlxA family with amidase domain|nr:helix-turn-helix domain-containing protein [Chitinophagaceae bacterium]